MSEVNKSEEGNTEKSKKHFEDPKAKFREALEKKRKVTRTRGKSAADGLKINRTQPGEKAPRIFRRKAGGL
jgi:hypothetical protein